MKMFTETKNYLEHGAKGVHDLPNNHTEGMDTAKLEKLSVQDAAQEVGKKYFEDRVAGTPGKLAEFQSLEKDGNAEKFAEHYKKYIVKPSELKKNDPEMYDYMKERVFNRREYADRPNEISFLNQQETGSREKAVPEVMSPALKSRLENAAEKTGSGRPSSLELGNKLNHHEDTDTSLRYREKGKRNPSSALKQK